jgi:cell wall-associated NlpC family hydrolase
MTQPRLLAALPFLMICAFAQAQDQTVLGKVGEAMNSTAVYTKPSKGSRMFYRVQAFDRLVVRHTTSEDWDAVLLKNRHYGYVPASDVAELPYTVYLTHHPRVSPTSSRGGGQFSSPGAGNALTEFATRYEGTPYEWGGNSLSSGIDCSGFVKEVMAGSIGKDLPRTAAEQSLVGLPLTRLEELRPGDRLYFRQKSDTKISHTGIYLGNGFFIHASHGKGKVTTDSLLKGSWRKILVAARR